MKLKYKKTIPVHIDAREKLLQAGVKIFALYGYEGASTRQLAKEAGVNISAILYYFKGKEGYYAAVLEYMAGQARAAMSSHIEKIRATLLVSDTDKGCWFCLEEFLEGFIGFLLGEQASPYLGRIFIREQMDPTPVFDSFYNNTMCPMHETITALVSRLTGLSGEEAVLCAQTIIGQVVIFKTHREVTLRRTGWKTYRREELAKIASVVLANVQAIIDVHKAKGKTS